MCECQLMLTRTGARYLILEIMDPNYVNPYQPPSPGVGYVMELGASPSDLALAEIGTRFVGWLVDGLIYVPVVIPGFVLQYSMGDVADAGDFSPLAIGVMLVGIFGLGSVQCYMIATSGQSIAKRLLGMRIVRLDGSRAGFLHGVVLRSWVMAFLTNIPFIGGFVALADALTIFGAERRCLHDRIADTIVIKA